MQVDAYGVEALLIGDSRIPNLYETVGDIQTAPLMWLGAFDQSRLIGAAAFTDNDRELDIDRLFVRPDQQRRGAGRLLVTELIRRAGTRAVTVSTGRKNGPALALYEGLGFSATDDNQVLPGLWTTRLRRFSTAR